MARRPCFTPFPPRRQRRWTSWRPTATSSRTRCTTSARRSTTCRSSPSTASATCTCGARVHATASSEYATPPRSIAPAPTPTPPAVKPRVGRADRSGPPRPVGVRETNATKYGNLAIYWKHYENNLRIYFFATSGDFHYCIETPDGDLEATRLSIPRWPVLAISP